MNGPRKSLKIYADEDKIIQEPIKKEILREKVINFLNNQTVKKGLRNKINEDLSIKGCILLQH